MRKIFSLVPDENYHLNIKFDSGEEKIFDMSSYLELPVFAPLKNKSVFQQVSNCGYFIEWKEQEIDLSADTLWHEGK